MGGVEFAEPRESAEMKTDWDLILKYLDNGTTPDEVKRIADLRKADPGFDKEIRLIEKVRRVPAHNLPEPDTEAALTSVKEKIKLSPYYAAIHKPEPQQKSPLFEKLLNSYIIRAAAIFVIFLAGVYLISKFYQTLMQEGVTISVNTTEVKEVTLPDGTIVTLDAGSRFNYPENFSAPNRTVSLNGEGYFKVTSDPNKPFIIQAPNATVTVLGTAFNLRAWDEYDKSIIAVEEGKVSFKSKFETEKEVILTKGEMSVIEGDTPPTPPVPAEVEQFTSWQIREMNFQNTTFKEVLDQLSRWYDLEFELPDDSYMNDMLTVYIKKEPIENILDLICIMMNFTYEKDGNRVVFKN